MLTYRVSAALTIMLAVGFRCKPIGTSTMFVHSRRLALYLVAHRGLDVAPGLGPLAAGRGETVVLQPASTLGVGRLPISPSSAADGIVLELNQIGLLGGEEPFGCLEYSWRTASSYPFRLTRIDDASAMLARASPGSCHRCGRRTA